MNDGVYTVFANNFTQVSSARTLEFTDGVPGQKVLVFSGIAIPGIDTNDDDDIGHPRVLCASPLVAAGDRCAYEVAVVIKPNAIFA